MLTTLGREVCPVFRSRTGDLVLAVRGKDTSGLPNFDLAGGILGRSDDMVVVRGVNLYPSSVDAVVRRFPEVAEYQVLCEEKGAMTEVSLRAEASEEAAGRSRPPPRKPFHFGSQWTGWGRTAAPSRAKLAGVFLS